MQHWKDHHSKSVSVSNHGIVLIEELVDDVRVLAGRNRLLHDNYLRVFAGRNPRTPRQLRGERFDRKCTAQITSPSPGERSRLHAIGCLPLLSG
jgi:hypothetical protein